MGILCCAHFISEYSIASKEFWQISKKSFLGVWKTDTVRNEDCYLRKEKVGKEGMTIFKYFKDHLDLYCISPGLEPKGGRHREVSLSYVTLVYCRMGAIVLTSWL